MRKTGLVANEAAIVHMDLAMLAVAVPIALPALANAEPAVLPNCFNLSPTIMARKRIVSIPPPGPANFDVASLAFPNPSIILPVDVTMPPPTDNTGPAATTQPLQPST